MNRLPLLTLFVFLPINILVAYPSLFFREECHSPLGTPPSAHSMQHDEKLVLSGLIYVDDKHWCLWVNNKVISPKHTLEFGGYRLKNVTPHYADFLNVSEQKVIRLLPYRRRPLCVSLPTARLESREK